METDNKYDTAIRKTVRSKSYRNAFDEISCEDDLIIDHDAIDEDDLTDVLQFGTDQEKTLAYARFLEQRSKDSGFTKDDSTGVASLGVDRSTYVKMLAQAEGESAYIKRFNSRY